MINPITHQRPKMKDQRQASALDPAQSPASLSGDVRDISLIRYTGIMSRRHEEGELVTRESPCLTRSTRPGEQNSPQAGAGQRDQRIIIPLDADEGAVRFHRSRYLSSPARTNKADAGDNAGRHETVSSRDPSSGLATHTGQGMCIISIRHLGIRRTAAG